MIEKFKNSNSDSTEQNSHFDTTQKFYRDNTQIAEKKNPKLNKRQNSITPNLIILANSIGEKNPMLKLEQN